MEKKYFQVRQDGPLRVRGCAVCCLTSVSCETLENAGAEARAAAAI
jgi:hypothetical protein